VHRLVASAFLGQSPEGKYDINHKNGDKADNSVANLEYCTSAENRKHAFATGLQSLKGEKHTRAKLTDEMVFEIRRRLAAGESQQSIARSADVDPSNISHIARGRRWAHLMTVGG
jgi:hypothetical protein